MIGPIPMDDFGDPFNPTGDGPTPTAVLAWQERQRRQRSVRLLMMFLMMLLLMDGEEPNRRRRESSIHLRQRGKRRGKGGAPIGRERMEGPLFEARKDQDERVREAAAGHGRFRDMLELNGGKDVERSIQEWASVTLEREETEAAEGENALSEKAKKKIAAEKAATSVGGMKKSGSATADEDAEAGKRKVYHYPRNATGYYRGDWKRIDGGGQDDEADSEDEGDVVGPNGAEDDFEPDVKVPESDQGGATTKAATVDAESGEYTLVDEDEVESALKRTLKKRRETLGVLLLPAGQALRSEANTNATAPFYAPGRVEPSASLRMSQPRLAELLGGGRSSSAKKKQPKLSLTRKSGRTAFQLYARPIPAMTELSIVEGFVKLYDGSSSAFVASTKRDVLLRVRGVLVHALGRMSLVANAGPGRSALVIGGATAGKAKKKKVAEEDEQLLPSRAEEGDAKPKRRAKGGVEGRSGSEEEGRSGSEEEERNEDRQRRLRAVLSDYLEVEGAPSFGGDGIPGSSLGDDNILDESVDEDGRERSAGLLEQIRDDALSLFEGTDSLGKMKSLWHERSTDDGAGWTLSSPELEEAGLDYRFDELFYGEPSRQMAELVGSHLSSSEGEAGSGWWPSLFAGRRSLRALEDPPTALADDATKVKDLQQRVAETEGLESKSEVSTIAEDKELAQSESEANALAEEEVEEAETGLDEESKSESVPVEQDGSEDTPQAEDTRRRTRSTEKRSAEEKTEEKAETEPLHIVKSDILRYPYAANDRAHTLSRVPAQLSRRIPHRELVLEANGLECEFELSFDVKEIQWTVGEWRAMAGRHARDVRDLDPHSNEEEEVESPEEAHESAGAEGKKQERTRDSHSRLFSATTMANSHYRGKKSPFGDESLAMQLNGTIISPNCGFRSTVNVTAIRTDWEHTTGKAINYSFYMMLTCLTQIVVLLRQLLHTQQQSAATRVSLLCVGWQTVLDAVLCVGHIFLCLVMQPLFTAFASVAFFKLLIFCVIEMKYMAIIMQARHNSANNPNNSAEELRRKVALLHLRFYAALMFATAGFWIFGQKHRTLYVLFLYSFWVPQIIRNIITEAKKPLHPYFIYGMSITRLVAPMYMFAVPNNFMKEVNPDFPTDLVMCELLILWVGVQAAILVAQGKYGARFMIPAIFLPPKFDYSRPIPPSMLPPPRPPSETAPSRNGSEDATQLLGRSAADSAEGAVKQRGPRSRRGAGGKSSRRIARTGEGSKGTMTISEPGDGGGTRPPHPTLDCVICYNDIDVSDRMAYMLAPCDHIFHRTCLEQWMDVKMECPICRKELPAL